MQVPAIGDRIVWADRYGKVLQKLPSTPIQQSKVPYLICRIQWFETRTDEKIVEEEVILHGPANDGRVLKNWSLEKCISNGEESLSHQTITE